MTCACLAVCSTCASIIRGEAREANAVHINRFPAVGSSRRTPASPAQHSPPLGGRVGLFHFGYQPCSFVVRRCGLCLGIEVSQVPLRTVYPEPCNPARATKNGASGFCSRQGTASNRVMPLSKMQDVLVVPVQLLVAVRPNNKARQHIAGKWPLRQTQRQQCDSRTICFCPTPS